MDISENSLAKRFAEADRKEFRKRIAKDMLDKMKDLRLSADDISRRRWVWELLQNAKDATRKEEPVSVSIDLRQNGASQELTFSHNGAPFTPDDLTFLIKQNSSKERGPNTNGEQETTGQFGTGFLTTHLLSERVTVRGIVENPGMGLVEFEIPLDRSGRTIEEMTESVDCSIEARDSIAQKAPIKNHDATAYNTAFVYPLDEGGVATMDAGLNDLYQSIPYVLAFNPSLGSITISHENLTFEVAERRSEDSNKGNIERVLVRKRKGDQEGLDHLLMVRGEKSEVALEYEVRGDASSLSGRTENVPKLFLDFPLLGTEDLPLPVVVNSSGFEPNEPRSGVYLSDREEAEVRQNKEIMGEACGLIETAIRYVSNERWANLYHLVSPHSLNDHDWLSKDWFKRCVQLPLRDKLSKWPIVETVDGSRATISNIEPEYFGVAHFPNHRKADYRQSIFDLLAERTSADRVLPKEAIIHEWYERIWNDCETIGYQDMAESISSIGSLDKLSKTLKSQDAIGWLNRFYNSLKEADELSIMEEKKVIPNQNNEFCSREELFQQESTIDETLKDIAEALGKDYREILVHSDVQLDFPGHQNKSEKDVARYISQQVEKEFGKSAEDCAQGALTQLHTWMLSNPVVAEEIFPGLYPVRARLRPNQELLEDKRKADAYDELQGKLATTGTSLEDLLTSLNADPGIERDSDEEALTDIILRREIKTAEDLEALKSSNPAIFEHIPESSIDKLEQWLRLLARTKQQIKEFLSGLPSYTVDEWSESRKYPTVITGVEKHGRSVTLVLRPSDGQKVIFYRAMELDVLELEDTELWIAAEHETPSRLTAGKILRKLGVDSGKGIHLNLN